jgi:ADP-heptose:LPS heptosyltransferase
LNRNILKRSAAEPVRTLRVACRTIAYWTTLRAKHQFSGRPVILIERPAGIGDIICTLPSVLELRKRHPDAVFIYNTRKSFKNVVEMGRVADLVVEWDRSWMPGLVHKYYYPRLEGERPLGREQIHLVDDFARAFEVELSSRQPRLHVPAALSLSVKKQIMPFSERAKHVLGIHVGPSWRVKEWTVTGWTKLVALLRDSFDCVVIQLGSDMDTARGLVRTPRIAGTEDWVDKLSLEESIAALEQLDLFVGIDSGLLHAAGAVGIPTVGLFGPSDPRLILPPETPSIGVVSDAPCLGCQHRLPRLHWRDGCPNNIQCMTGLTAENALNACVKLLAAVQSDNEDAWQRRLSRRQISDSQHAQ